MDINSSRFMVDSWSWFPRIAAQGILDSMAGPKALKVDSAASVVLDPNILSPDCKYWIYVSQAKLRDRQTHIFTDR